MPSRPSRRGEPRGPIEGVAKRLVIADQAEALVTVPVPAVEQQLRQVAHAKPSNPSARSTRRAT